MAKEGEKVPTRVLPGFMELLPADQIVFNRMLDTIRSVYEQYGFVPIDTPVIERADVLLAKVGGETAKQIYRLTKGDNELALRFDLTVPLARYVAEHAEELAFPFRRYHIGKVYRGESPQKGRYREFYQCDIDIIGNGSLSLINDAEIPRIVYDVFMKLGIGAFVIRLNNRKLITGLLNSAGVGELAVEVMRTVDKIEKVGAEEVRQTLTSLGIAEPAVQQIFDFLSITGSADEVIEGLRSLEIKEESFQLGISELFDVVKCARALGMPDSSFAIDLSIARGLDYYTGTVYETVLVDHPGVGSICSGGRFDNLAEKYTDRKLPGVGISIGLTRLFSQLKEVGIVKSGASTLAKVLVIPLVEDPSVSLEIATMLRTQGLSVEVYLEESKMKKKMAYADKIGVPFVVLVGEDEISSGMFVVKNMATRQQNKVSKDQIFSEITRS
ncbi:MAG: histidine--tRNA ligase [bacterium]|nr:histidine--tRNA ligase [bacterium]